MKLVLQDMEKQLWEIDTGLKKDLGPGKLALEWVSKYEGCQLYGKKSSIFIYGNGKERGAKCMDEFYKTNELSKCNGCDFLRLRENEYYAVKKARA